MYNDLYGKFVGKSSWVKPELSLAQYTSRFAPRGDGANNPEGYANRIAKYVSDKIGQSISSTDSIQTILDRIEQAGFDPVHTMTEAQMLIENSAKTHTQIKSLFK